MSDTNGTVRPPLGIRLLHALGREPDWSAMTPEELAAFAAAQNRKRSSPVAEGDNVHAHGPTLGRLGRGYGALACRSVIAGPPELPAGRAPRDH